MTPQVRSCWKCSLQVLQLGSQAVAVLCEYALLSTFDWWLWQHVWGPQVECTLLRDLHPHPRDLNLRFEQETHTYYINGRPTLGTLAYVSEHHELDSYPLLVSDGLEVSGTALHPK